MASGMQNAASKQDHAETARSSGPGEETEPEPCKVDSHTIRTDVDDKSDFECQTKESKMYPPDQGIQVDKG